MRIVASYRSTLLTMSHFLEKNNCTISYENVPNCEVATAEFETTTDLPTVACWTPLKRFRSRSSDFGVHNLKIPLHFGSSRPPLQHHLRRTDAAAAREKHIPNTRNGAQTSGVYTEAKPAKAAKHPPAMMVNGFSRSPNRASICHQSTPKTDKLSTRSAVQCV